MKKTMRLFLALTLAFSFVLAAGCSANQPAEKKEQSDAVASVSTDEYADVDFLISADKLEEMLQSKDLVLLDCNKPEMYEKGHIPGAVSVGFHAFSDTVGKPGDPGWGTVVPKEELQKRLEALGITNDKTVVFYSDVFKGPGADGRAVWQLKLAGLENVKFLMGGLSKWQELGKEITTEATQPHPASPVVLKDYDTSYIATKEQVLENLNKQPLLDVRTQAEYQGSQKAGEPRGGHIPGAVPMLWLELLNKDGTPKAKQEIIDLMASHNVQPNDDFTVY